MAGKWIEQPFADVIDFQEGPGILAKDFCAEGVPLVRLSGLDRSSSVLAGCNYLDPKTVAKRWAHFALAKGDILLSTSASLGRIAVVGDDGVGAIPYTGIIRMRPRDGRLIAPFIRYLLEGPEFQQQAEMVGVGSVIRHFGPLHLRQMSVRFPPVEEQRRIAHILGTLDDKIELNRRMNETVEAMARAVFKSWFVDAVEEGRIRGFEEGSVGDLVELGRKTVSPNQFPSEVFEHYSLPAFDEGRLPKLELGSEIRSNKFVVPTAAVLLSKLNPRIPRVWLPAVTNRWRSICSTEFLVTIPKAGASREFIYALLTSRYFLDEFTTLVSGTSGSHQRVDADSLRAMRALIPPGALLDRFTFQVRPLFQRVQLNIDHSRTLAALRDALLPKLISGELRLKDCEKFIERRD